MRYFTVYSVKVVKSVISLMWMYHLIRMLRVNLLLIETMFIVDEFVQFHN